MRTGVGGLTLGRRGGRFVERLEQQIGLGSLGKRFGTAITAQQIADTPNTYFFRMGITSACNVGRRERVGASPNSGFQDILRFPRQATLSKPPANSPNSSYHAEIPQCLHQQ